VKDLITDLLDRLQSEASSEGLIVLVSWRKAMRRKRILKLGWRRTLPSSKQLFRSPASWTVRLQVDLGALSAQQLKMDAMPVHERKIFATTKEDLQQDIAGVQKAMGVLREYYGPSFVQQPGSPEVHQSSGGAGTSILEILEVIESGFFKNLAELSLSASQRQSRPTRS